MKEINKVAIWEAIKEVARIAFFAAITAAVGWATQQLTQLDPTSIYYVGGTVILRFIDKWIHESQKTELKGIAPF